MKEHDNYITDLRKEISKQVKHFLSLHRSGIVKMVTYYTDKIKEMNDGYRVS
jgi:hypothetical protein